LLAHMLFIFMCISEDINILLTLFTVFKFE
jgi:hypothetical protein